MAASTELEANLAQAEQLEHAELKSCDRCYKTCYRAYWSSSNGTEPKLKLRKTANEPSTSSDYFLTAGRLLETGPAGSVVFDLSQKIAKAPSLTTKRRHHVLGQSFRVVQLIDAELENIKTQLLSSLQQKIGTRQQGILQGTADEYKNAVVSISERYRERRAECNTNCFQQMENLRRQLKADIDFEERAAIRKTEEAVERRLKEVDDKLKEMGCAGSDFSIPSTDIKLQPSSLCRIEYEGKLATSLLPIPTRLTEAVKEKECDELQTFLLYARMSNGKDQKRTKRKFKVEQVEPLYDGLIEEFAEQDTDDED